MWWAAANLLVEHAPPELGVESLPPSPQAVREGLQAKLGDAVAPSIGCQAAKDTGDVDHSAPGLQQQGQQSAGQPHVTGLRATMEQGPRAGWAAVTVMLAGQREVLSALVPEFQPRREGGVEGGEGGGGAWWGASLPALGESLPLPSHWSPG